MFSKTIELLAPAGDETCLHAAVRAGADAVYLGVQRFNARRGAGNFDQEGLARALDYAHLRGVRVYLTVNTAILPSETQAAMELVRQSWRAGVDAFIVQDVGLAAEMRRTLPQARLHISTQMNTHNAAGIEAAAALGASRVTLAREMSLPEVERLCGIAGDFGIEVEAFCHGALCICYSGQCLASSMVGGRSANRGMCAQPCRLPYELKNAALRKKLASPGPHLLSPKDACAIDLLPELLSCGVSSLKVEGRMKSPEYVFAVVKTYRAVLDRVLRAHDGLDASAGEAALGWQEAAATLRGHAAEGLDATPGERQALSEAFSRGFTTAYLERRTGNDMMSFARPNNRGVFCGRVARVRDGVAEVACELALHDGDVIEFWTNKGHFAQTVEHAPAPGQPLRIRPGKRVGKGDRVFRVRSAEAAFVDVPGEPKVGVRAVVDLRIGSPARIELSAGDVRAAAEGPVVEPARTKALRAEEVREHVARLGNTPFSLEGIEVRLDEGAGMGFSQLHKLRADAAAALEDALLAPWRGRRLQRSPKREPRTACRVQGCEVAVLVANAACARAARKAGADRIFVAAVNYPRGEAMVAGQRSATVEQAGYPNRVQIALPVVDHDPAAGSREQKFGFDAWRYVKPGHAVLAENLGQVVRAAGMGAHPEAGPHIPALNPLAVAALARAGARRVWLSPELALGQVQQIAEASPVPLGITIMGACELMVTEHCLLQSQGPCAQDCDACPRRKSPHYLQDRKGFEMPVVTDLCGRSHLYNAVPLDVAHLVPDLLHAGVSSLMVDATLMTVEATRAAVARAVRARDIGIAGTGAVSRAEGTTTGHLLRTVQ